MSKIKVTVNSISQANEIIEYWSDKGVELFIEVRENTTAENSDVDFILMKANGSKLIKYLIKKEIYDNLKSNTKKTSLFD